MTYPIVKTLDELAPTGHSPFIQKAIDAFPFLASPRHAVILHDNDTGHNAEVADRALELHAINHAIQEVPAEEVPSEVVQETDSDHKEV